MDNKEKIKLLDENNNEVEANILNIVEIDNQEYLLYSIDKNNEEENIYALKIIKNATGEEDLIPITDNEEKKQVSDIINEIINDID